MAFVYYAALHKFLMVSMLGLIEQRKLVIAAMTTKDLHQTCCVEAGWLSIELPLCPTAATSG